MFAAVMINRVSGDGHRGISLSGVSRSACGSQLRAPAAVMGRDGSPNRPFGGLGEPALPKAPANHPVSGFPLS